ncbi:helix-turn-helix transcriptional regulator [Polaromonas sp.]|uniref:helix-turn-helix transcriptional regulator n=1 Tax=Polaromonas sp. TaxID=1869339 RepID=UPI003568CF98
MATSTGPKPQLSIHRGWALYAGPVNQNRAHHHHAHQIAWSLDTDLVAVGEQGAVRGPGYVACSAAVRRVEPVVWLQTIYITPEIEGAQWCVERAGGSLSALTLHEAMQLSAILSVSPGPNAANGEAASDPEPIEADARLTKVLRHLEESLDKPLRAHEVAKWVGISPSRFLHWFTDTLGLPFRPYVRWLRLQAAVRSLAQGGNLTEAAHFAGFADSAHLSRTFVSAFGITPNALASVVIPVSDVGFPMQQIVQALNAEPVARIDFGKQQV